MVDIKTFMLVLGIGNICFAGLVAGYARSMPVNPALRMWQWAKVTQGLAHLLAWLRPDWPLLWLAFASNSLLLLGVVMDAAAYSMFFKLRHWRRVLVPLALLALVAVNGARFAGAPSSTLAMIISLTIGALSGTMAMAVLLSKGYSSALQRIIGINNLIFCGAMLWRAVASALDPSMTPMTSSGAQSFAFIIGYVVMMVNGFGFLLLCKEEDDRKMERLATLDSLTGVANRRAFFEMAAASRMLASRQRHPISLMMLDIDFFKELNDRYGHAAGDAALCVFTQAVQRVLREPDILGRLGGEEFGVVLPATDLAGALQAAERVRLAVRSEVLPSCDLAYGLTVSIGVVLLDRDEDITAALARADRALYAAKEEGRDRVVVGAPVRGAVQAA